MTVKDMAARLQPKVEGKASYIVRAIQHWTTQGLLVPIGGEAHQGTGRHREYDLEALHRAAILFELAKYGLQIRHFRAAMRSIDKALGRGPLGSIRFKGEPPIYTAAFSDAVKGEEVRFVFGFRLEESGTNLWAPKSPIKYYPERPSALVAKHGNGYLLGNRPEDLAPSKSLVWESHIEIRLNVLLTGL